MVQRSEAVVHTECLPVRRITGQSSVVASGLRNDTLYRVMVVTTDLVGHQDAWTALVRTQDMTPPWLRLVDAPPPRFTGFDLVATLDEAGTVYAGLALAGAGGGAAGPSTPAACPPVFAVSSRGILGGGFELPAWSNLLQQ